MRKLSLLFALLALCSGVSVAQKKPGPVERPSQPSNTPQNKEIIRHMFDDVWNKGQYGLMSNYFAPNCVFHEGSKTLSLSDMQQEVRGLRSGAPDLRMVANAITESGNTVSVSWTGHGTNTGQGLWPPTGKPFTERGTSVFHFTNGKISEVDTQYDLNQLKQHLGVGKK